MSTDILADVIEHMEAELPQHCKCSNDSETCDYCTHLGNIVKARKQLAIYTEIMGDMPDPLAARRVAGITCNHLPRLTIASENGYICCECWALELNKLETDIRESIASFLPADANIDERQTLDALNMVFREVMTWRKNTGDAQSQLTTATARLAEAERDAKRLREVLTKVQEYWKAHATNHWYSLNRETLEVTEPCNCDLCILRAAIDQATAAAREG